MDIMFYLLISVTINGQSWEGIPQRFYTADDCEAAKAQYVGIVNRAPVCFPATAEMMIAAGLKP